MEIHIVRQGDTVWQIAKKYGVSPQRIISDNSIVNPRNLVVGQALLILKPESVYRVRPGDTLYTIAEKTGVPVITLMQNNPSVLFKPLDVGQVLALSFTEQKKREIVLNAYAYPNVQPDILISALPYLTYLTIFGYGFTLEGELIDINDQPLIQLAYQYRTAPVMLLCSITEDGTFSGERASRLFQDKALQDKVLDQVLKTMEQKRYVGLDVDFEYVDAKDKDAFISFLENTRDRLHRKGYFLNTDLAPKTSREQKGLLYEAHDYARIGAVSDTVLLMTYEWGYTYGPL